MLIPSYSELMEVIKQGERLDSRVTSRYTVVLAAAKRARQLTDGANPLTYAPTDRAVSIAVKEMNEGKLRIKVDDSLIDSDQEFIRRGDIFRYRSTLSKDDLREDLKQDYAPTPYDMDSDEEHFTPFVAEEKATTKDEDDMALYEDNDDEPSFALDDEQTGE